ncbi:unnamed protein product [Owenia fusiformis]|uniref:Uncharacterized protein n=1 Tax=Owenia fusiformis TaxID=6347 RepID=A0A8J1YAB8_OWEFU|nr:unnamed protein product [Owenia fusiformis]
MHQLIEENLKPINSIDRRMRNLHQNTFENILFLKNHENNGHENLFKKYLNACLTKSLENEYFPDEFKANSFSVYSSYIIFQDESEYLKNVAIHRKYFTSSVHLNYEIENSNCVEMVWNIHCNGCFPSLKGLFYPGQVVISKLIDLYFKNCITICNTLNDIYDESRNELHIGFNIFHSFSRENIIKDLILVTFLQMRTKSNVISYAILHCLDFHEMVHEYDCHKYNSYDYLFSVLMVYFIRILSLYNWINISKKASKAFTLFSFFHAQAEDVQPSHENKLAGSINFYDIKQYWIDILSQMGEISREFQIAKKSYQKQRLWALFFIDKRFFKRPIAFNEIVSNRIEKICDKSRCL